MQRDTIHQPDATFLQFKLTQIEFPPQLHANSDHTAVGDSEFSKLAQHVSHLKSWLWQSQPDDKESIPNPCVQLRIPCTQYRRAEVARTLDGVLPLAEWSQSLSNVWEENKYVEVLQEDEFFLMQAN